MANLSACIMDIGPKLMPNDYKKAKEEYEGNYKKVYDYVRYDLKEIAFPSSLPHPPGTKRRPKLTLKEKWCFLKEATRLYGASWVRDIGPELRPNDYKKAEEESYPSNSEEGKTKSEPTVLEDLAVAARGGGETLKPALRRIYMTRASTYTSAVKNYVETYQEGLKDLLDEKAAGKGHQPGNEPRRSLMSPPPPQSSS
ncbi:hypothetical protein TRIUR3_10830 [Triticum urartu]|uniref:Uncharacterized protein n=1 Tax=Triticum urartu TaxID=4572 RepID=M7YJW1_TRIUA|nr:hypothetical protein TRIUR3_10830 [Triticum urartu]